MKKILRHITVLCILLAGVTPAVGQASENGVLTGVGIGVLAGIGWLPPVLRAINKDDAQSVKISDVRFEQQGDRVAVHYYLKNLTGKKLKNVRLLVSYNGKDYRRADLVSGDVGSVSGSGQKTVFWEAALEYDWEAAVAGMISFRVEADPNQADATAFYQYEYSPTAPIGLTFGYAKRYGMYMRMRYSADVFSGKKDEPAGQNPHYNMKKDSYHRFAITAGPLFRLNRWAYAYAGLGYGEYNVIYSSQNGHNDYGKHYYGANYIKGVEMEAGLMFRFCRFISLSGGYVVLPSSTGTFSDFTLGLGVMW